jgi:hypothetical protein
MARIASAQEILGILASGNFERLLGMIEDEHVEFKEQPYHLDNDERKMELAKDVSALANVHEGVIVLGPRTARPDASTSHDEVVAISPFEASLVDAEQYHRTLAALVFPTLENIEIRWYASLASATRGLVGLRVPAQRQLNRPFLTTKTLNESGRLSERSFGLFERRRATAAPVSVYEVHGWLRAGRAGSMDALDSVVSRLEALATRAPSRNEVLPAGEGAVAAESESTQERRLKEALEAVERFDKPTIALVAVPSRVVQVREFLDRHSRLVNDMAAPPTIRQYGFDLKTGGQVQLIEGRVRRSVTPDFKLLEVWRDGLVQFIAPGDTDLSLGTR